ncbi:hypothetical protein [Fodinicola feengrottensis]|uniref:Uncharacterized protein n=1 Tax=Fodinicola feengrottensis TaxID=435914 RepID=A0ABP4RWV4_9ACTN|nr:hypothetical protein [Fodinicola feengrottensis]
MTTTPFTGEDRRSPVAATVAAAVAIILLPWIVFLANTLPPTMLAERWSTAWVGLDLAIAVGAGTAAVLLFRRDSRAIAAMCVTAGLMCTDSWFDICTSNTGSDLVIAIAEAFLLELPLAGAAMWFSVRSLRTVGQPASLAGVR